MADINLTITIPEAKAQRVLDGYGVDNETDLKASIIAEMKQTITQAEYKKAIKTSRDGITDLEL